MSIAKPADPNLTWSFELPVRLKVAIADCITLYARIESIIVELVWILEGADLARKKEIAASWGNQNLKIIKNVIKAIPDTKIGFAWPILNKLRNERNIIGHGVWMLASDDRPLVVWHARFLENPDWVGSEYFDWHRFDIFIKNAEAILKMFTSFMEWAEQEIERQKASRED